MATTISANDNLYSNGSIPSFKIIHDWLASFQDGKVPSTLNYDLKLNCEIHLAITEEPSEYVSLICDHLFSLYHNVKHRLFVLQFLPSFITAFYNVLYQHRYSESNDAKTKDVCSTIDTFLVSLYNLGVIDDGRNDKIHEFRIPNLTASSIYHTLNPEHYAPTPLTQHAISKHEQKYEVVRLQSFTPFDSINGTTKEQILLFLLIQYGNNVCFMDQYSRQSYIKMSKKLLGQGFSFNNDIPPKIKPNLPPTGRRIHVSSRIMSEILGTLYYIKFNSSDNEADECMRLLKRRAEYEMYADVLLVTESIEYLHGFELQRPTTHDIMGIEIELPPTIDMVLQKRTATTRRSMKNRHHEHKNNATTVLSETSIDENVNIKPATPQQRSKIHNTNENFLPVENKICNDNENSDSSPIIDEVRSNISSSIGPATSTPSPSTSHYYKPVSLTSTQNYFKNSQHQKHDSPPILQIKTTKYPKDKHEGQESIVTVTIPHNSSTHRVGGKRDIIATARFRGDIPKEKDTNIEETYL